MSKITNNRLNPVWHRIIYSCADMATVGVKRLNRFVVHYSYLTIGVH